MQPGHLEDGKERMVKTPWSEKAMPFPEAAKIGTQKVIREHSTIGSCDHYRRQLRRTSQREFQEAEEKTDTGIEKAAETVSGAWSILRCPTGKKL